MTATPSATTPAASIGRGRSAAKPSRICGASPCGSRSRAVRGCRAISARRDEERRGVDGEEHADRHEREQRRGERPAADRERLRGRLDERVRLLHVLAVDERRDRRAVRRARSSSSRPRARTPRRRAPRAAASRRARRSRPGRARRRGRGRRRPSAACGSSGRRRARRAGRRRSPGCCPRAGRRRRRAGRPRRARTTSARCSGASRRARSPRPRGRGGGSRAGGAARARRVGRRLARQLQLAG